MYIGKIFFNKLASSVRRRVSRVTLSSCDQFFSSKSPKKADSLFFRIRENVKYGSTYLSTKITMEKLVYGGMGPRQTLKRIPIKLRGSRAYPVN